MSKQNDDIRDDALDISAEIAEPVFDDLSTGVVKTLFGADIKDAAEDTPGLKVIVFAGKLFRAGTHWWQARKLQAFLTALKDGDAGITAFERLNDKQKQDLRAFIISELDKQTSEKQAEALGYLLVAYFQGKIDRLMFDGVAHEIKNINPRAFAFNIDGFTRSNLGTATRIEGPVHYLPAAFVSNSTEKIMFSSSGPFLTNLGDAFFPHVYDPMAARETL